jgi:hypothetical protein
MPSDRLQYSRGLLMRPDFVVREFFALLSRVIAYSRETDSSTARRSSPEASLPQLTAGAEPVSRIRPPRGSHSFLGPQQSRNRQLFSLMARDVVEEDMGRP